MSPTLVAILLKTFSYAACGSLAAVALRLWNRGTPGPSLDQSAGVGALVGAGFGAMFGIFKAMMTRL